MRSMRRLPRSYIERVKESINYIASDRMFSNPYGDLKELERGCWYRGKVVGLNRGDPVIFVGHKVPDIIVKRCNEEVKKGDLLLCEVFRVRGNYALGTFKEIFRKEDKKS